MEDEDHVPAVRIFSGFSANFNPNVGLLQERYLPFVNWDALALTISGSIVALLGLLFILFWDKIKKFNLDAGFIGILIVFFGFWEIWEFFVDTFFGGSAAGLIQANNTDTMTDMNFVQISPLIVGIGV